MHALTRNPDERVNRVTSVPFFLLHLLPLLALITGATLFDFAVCFVLYYARVFFITAGYHRYFSHRSYKATRPMQFILGFGGTTAAQKGPLWWAAHHRDHHRYSDTEQDIHSPLKGFWWSHMGWILCDKYNETKLDNIRDFAKYPEIRWLNKYDWVGPWVLAVSVFFLGATVQTAHFSWSRGFSALLIGFFLSTVLLWHGTFIVNSLAHVFGRRRYATTDTSRNSVLIAILTNGEGWHNNHHYYQASARQGFFWWEIDISFYIIKALSYVGLTSDIKVPTETVLNAGRVKDGAFDIGMFRAYWAKAAAAVAASKDHAGEVLDAKKAAFEAGVEAKKAALEAGVEAKKASIEASVDAKREALSGVVEATRQSAEEFAKLSRRSRRMGFEG